LGSDQEAPPRGGRPDVGDADGMEPKVSVVVPTYAPGSRINRLVRSLDAQTMPTRQFEVIFVDDGSPDRTWERLQRIRDARDNVRIERIENSGWPSRPRNVGLELARGEYVLFMDHDDELYPHALEAGYRMAARTGADVLNGKETRTDQAKWALEVYVSNMDNAIDRQDIHPLIPTNPHKLFRRSFLLEHGIRFPEGRRVLWEDVFFALDVARHAKVISVMADTPFYHWVRVGKTASSSYTQDLKEYWHWVREIVVQTNEKLGSPELAAQWRLMLLHQYRSRVLAPLGASIFQADPDVQDFVKTTVTDIICNHIPTTLDAHLTPTQRGRAALVRAGRWDLLEILAGIDAGLIGIGRSTSIRWVDGVLEIKGESRWATADGEPLAIRYDGGRIVRDLPKEVAAALPAEALDMTAALDAASTSFGIRARETGVTWMLPGTCETRIESAAGRPELVVSATAVLDPRTAALGRPLDETSWDVTARNELLGAINQRGLRTSTPARSAVQDGHVYIAYRNMSGMLSLDVDETHRSLAGSAKLDPNGGRSTVRRAGRLKGLLQRRSPCVVFELPFTGVTTTDDSVIDGSIVVGSRSVRPARIVARRDGAWLEASAEERPGSYPMMLKFHGRSIDSGLDITIGPQGDVAFSSRSRQL
jgi:glycosyltransferase involved in cell wall biosynthesis